MTLVLHEKVTSADAKRVVKALGASDIAHRKNWEYVFIIRALEKLNMLQPGRRGLVFAAGDEPLISYFASKGVEVVATDMFPDQEGVELWSTTGQHASAKEGLFKAGLVSREEFDRLVSFQHANMNHISKDFYGQFDFVWSTCSLEHVGSISLGHRFALESMELLKPGGAAVHTVEFTLSSLDQTIERGDTALWRQDDMQRLYEDHCRLGYSMEAPCWNAGGHLHDLQPDVPPYSQDNHVKLLIGSYVCTSMGWVAQKTQTPPGTAIQPLPPRVRSNTLQKHKILGTFRKAQTCSTSPLQPRVATHAEVIYSGLVLYIDCLRFYGNVCAAGLSQLLFCMRGNGCADRFRGGQEHNEESGDASSGPPQVLGVCVYCQVP